MDMFFFTKLGKTVISKLQLSDEEDNHLFIVKCFLSKSISCHITNPVPLFDIRERVIACTFF